MRYAATAAVGGETGHAGGFSLLIGLRYYNGTVLYS